MIFNVNKMMKLFFWNFPFSEMIGDKEKGWHRMLCTWVLSACFSLRSIKSHPLSTASTVSQRAGITNQSCNRAITKAALCNFPSIKRYAHLKPRPFVHHSNNTGIIEDSRHESSLKNQEAQKLGGSCGFGILRVFLHAPIISLLAIKVFQSFLL